MAKFMASTVAGTAVNRPARTAVGSNELVVIGESIAVTAAQLTLGALFGNIKVPKNAEIAWVMLDATDLDTNGSPAITLSIGDVTVDDRLLAANTIAQTGAAVVGPTIAKTGLGYQYTAETAVQVKVKVIPGTAAAGTIKYVIAYVSQG